MWLLIAFVQATFDEKNYKMDIVCYEQMSTMCQYALSAFSPTSPDWENIKDRIGSTRTANPYNAKTALNSLKSYIIVVLLADSMTGDKPTDVFDLGSLSTNHVIEFAPMGFGASLMDDVQALKNVTHAVWARNFTNKEDFQKATRQAFTALHHKPKVSAVSPSRLVYVTAADGDSHSKVDSLFLVSVRMALRSDLHVQAAIASESIVSPDSSVFRADYFMTRQEVLEELYDHLVSKKIDVVDMGLIHKIWFQGISRVVCSGTGWTIEFSSLETLTIPRELFTGNLSLLLLSHNDESETITIAPGMLQPGETLVPGLNLSIQDSGALKEEIAPPGFEPKTLAESPPNLTVTLEGWDKMTQKFDLVLEAEDPESITVAGTGWEGSVDITRSLISERPMGPGSSSTINDNGDGPDIGLIVGVVVAVVAVVVIVIVLVYIFVFRKKKQESSESNGQGTASA